MANTHNFSAALQRTPLDVAQEFFDFLAIVIAGTDIYTPTESVDQLFHSFLMDPLCPIVEGRYSCRFSRDPSLSSHDLQAAYQRYMIAQLEIGGHEVVSASMDAIKGDPAKCGISADDEVATYGVDDTVSEARPPAGTIRTDLIRLASAIR